MQAPIVLVILEKKDGYVINLEYHRDVRTLIAGYIEPGEVNEGVYYAFDTEGKNIEFFTETNDCGFEYVDYRLTSNVTSELNMVKMLKSDLKETAVFKKDEYLMNRLTACQASSDIFEIIPDDFLLPRKPRWHLLNWFKKS